MPPGHALHRRETRERKVIGERVHADLVIEHYVELFVFDLFFFSSRRRHTRSKRDWSSDVCSSDLIDDTVIEDGVKLDNQIQVGHNVRIGAHTAIAGCAGIAGSADIGRHCTIGGAAIIIGHLRIVDHVNISAGTLVSRSLLKPGTYTGVYPFDEHSSWARAAAALRRKGKKNG